MLSQKQLTLKKWRKELKRRKLRAWRRHLISTMGEHLGNHAYAMNRKSAAERRLLLSFRKHHKEQRPPLPVMVPARVEEKKSVRSMIRKVFS